MLAIYVGSFLLIIFLILLGLEGFLITTLVETSTYDIMVSNQTAYNTEVNSLTLNVGNYLICYNNESFPVQITDFNYTTSLVFSMSDYVIGKQVANLVYNPPPIPDSCLHWLKLLSSSIKVSGNLNLTLAINPTWIITPMVIIYQNNPSGNYTLSAIPPVFECIEEMKSIKHREVLATSSCSKFAQTPASSTYSGLFALTVLVSLIDLFLAVGIFCIVSHGFCHK